MSALRCKRAFLLEVRRSQRAFSNLNNSTLGYKDKQHVSCGLFMNVFSAFEAGIAELFVSYALGNKAIDGTSPNRYVLPRDRLHVWSIAKGSQQVVFWADAGRVIERASDWFDGGYKIADSLRTHKNVLDKSRKIRNIIAHKSDEALSQFLGVWTSDIGPSPVKPPHPGDLLLRRKRKASDPTMFEVYTSEIELAFCTACGA